jgi:hypothetical protein
LILASPSVCLGDEPKAIKVDVTLRFDHVGLAPVGDPPIFSMRRRGLALGELATRPVRRPTPGG